MTTLAPDIATLFRPFDLHGVALANRLVMAPMTRSMSPGRTPTAEVAAYYRRRAEGGVGLIITEGTSLADPASTSDHKVPMMAGEAPLAGWRRVVNEVHAAGGKIFPQLWHVGVLRKAEETAAPERETMSPSGWLLPGKQRGKAMNEQDIADTIGDYAEAALNAKSLGFDGVELHGAHGYLIDQFFWSGTNRRTDRWGGDLVGRTRFAEEVVRAVRDAVGSEFPLVLRWSQWKQQDFAAKLATDPAELAAFLEPLTLAGVDCFHCSTRRYWEPEFPPDTAGVSGKDASLNLAGWVKKITGKPTITVGSIGLDQEFVASYRTDEASRPQGIDELLRRLEADEFDLVAVGRALIANPDWPHFVAEGRLAEAKPYDRSLLAELV